MGRGRRLLIDGNRAPLALGLSMGQGQWRHLLVAVETASHQGRRLLLHAVSDLYADVAREQRGRRRWTTIVARLLQQHSICHANSSSIAAASARRDDWCCSSLSEEMGFGFTCEGAVNA